MRGGVISFPVFPKFILALGAVSRRFHNEGMPVRCSKCGEELMGSVNRCWRCGLMFGHTTDEDARPPVRRAPVALNATEGEVVAVAIEPANRDAEQTDAESEREPDEVGVSLRGKIPWLCAYASSVIGGIGCLTGWFIWWSMFPALLGIALGVLGLNSDRRDVAVTGIVLCSIALFAASVNAAYIVFSIYWGRQLLESF